MWLKNGDTEHHRLFDPYDGADLGDAEPRATRIFEKVAEFHDNLLGDRVGRELNGVGGNHPRGHVPDWHGHLVARHQGLASRPAARWNTSWKRFNWDLHSVMGFWTFALVFMWAITGVYMVFPDPFLDIVDFLQPPSDDVPLGQATSRSSGSRESHIGRFAGLWVKVLWAGVGLIPPALLVTGVIMWWNRKVRGWVRAEEGPYTSYLKTFFKRSV